jgi:hypothetical protein
MSDSSESESKERQSQKAAAEALQRQIDELTSGKSRPARPSSLRDFIERKMAEDKLKNEKNDG